MRLGILQVTLFFNKFAPYKLSEKIKMVHIKL